MTLQDVQSNYDNTEKLAKQNYIKDFCRWLKEFYPTAETFEFNGHWESDDEGGSDLYFSSLYFNDEDFAGILAENKELAEKFFADYKDQEFYRGTFEECIVDEDWIREYLHEEMCNVPGFMYDKEYSIKEELKDV